MGVCEQRRHLLAPIDSGEVAAGLLQPIAKDFAVADRLPLGLSRGLERILEAASPELEIDDRFSRSLLALQIQRECPQVEVGALDRRAENDATVGMMGVKKDAELEEPSRGAAVRLERRVSDLERPSALGVVAESAQDALDRPGVALGVGSDTGGRIHREQSWPESLVHVRGCDRVFETRSLEHQFEDAQSERERVVVPRLLRLTSLVSSLVKERLRMHQYALAFGEFGGPPRRPNPRGYS
jgi:hypothetical protein